MEKHTYKYRFSDWTPGEWEEWTTEDGYHYAAERICESYDNRKVDFPDERVITLQDLKHDTPRKFMVYAETVREYEANEILK